MKFKVQMKDPDTLDDAIVDAVTAELNAQGVTDDDERQALREVRVGKARACAARWFRYGEYLTVELDTEEKTCVVVTAKD